MFTPVVQLIHRYLDTDILKVFIRLAIHFSDIGTDQIQRCVISEKPYIAIFYQRHDVVYIDQKHNWT